jgi:alpha-tubulin suppressor-like RCC1 family protein
MRTTHHPTDGPADSTVAAPYRLPVLATRAGRRERPLSAWVVAVTLLVVGAVTVTVMAADSSSPAAAAPASAWAQVSAGANHTCALTVAGEAFCWGSDGFGQLGNGAAITVDQVSPSPVNTPAGVTWASISVGERHTCALTVTGEAFCWGSDAQGRLGNGAAFTSNRVSPSPVNTPAGVTWDRMSAGLAQTCGVTVTGEAFCWGDDLFGQLGNGALTGDRESPSEVDDPAGVTWASISAGLLHTCGVTDAGEGFCWGNDGFGQLGNGSSVTGNQVTPSPVVAPAGVTWSSIDTGGFHSCGLTDAGAAFCWGEGFFGRLGNGAAGDESSPSPVDTPVGVTWAAISAREEHTCAVSDAGDAFCWGRDSSGQLGNGAALDTDRVSPSPVDTPAGVTWSAVSAVRPDRHR